jgi:hypothetical protein
MPKVSVFPDPGGATTCRFCFLLAAACCWSTSSFTPLSRLQLKGAVRARS